MICIYMHFSNYYFFGCYDYVLWKYEWYLLKKNKYRELYHGIVVVFTVVVRGVLILISG